MNFVRIENRKELRSGLRGFLEWSFTGTMWALWIYFFLPLLTVVLWFLGGSYIHFTLFTQHGLEHLWGLIARLGGFVLCVAIVIHAWGLYNYYIFGRKNRRRRPTTVSADDMGAHFGLAADEVVALQARQEIVWSETYDAMRDAVAARRNAAAPLP